METTVRRPLTPKESLKESLKEVKLFQEGKVKLKSWDELYEDLKKDE